MINRGSTTAAKAATTTATTDAIVHVSDPKTGGQDSIDQASDRDGAGPQ